MQNRNWVLGIVLIILVAVLAGVASAYYLWRTPNQSREVTSLEPVASPTPPASPLNTAQWETFTKGYSLLVPPGWKPSINAPTRVALQPGTPVGNLQEISLTTLNDAQSPAEATYATQAKFDEWLTATEVSDPSVTKIGTPTVDGFPAIKLLSNQNVSDWSVVTWMRRGAGNVYLTVRGQGDYGGIEEQAVNAILESFSFGSTPLPGTASVVTPSPN